MQRVVWDLTATPPESEGEGEGGNARRGRRARPSRVGAGTYTAVLVVGGEEQRHDFEVVADD